MARTPMSGVRRPSATLVLLLAVGVLLGASTVRCAPPLERPATGVPLAGDGRGAAGAQPAIKRAELWYATTPGDGVWAELRLILDNPLTLNAERTVLRLPAGVMDDFRVRGSEPDLLWPPVVEADGRHAFVFPAPIARSQNWYRLYLAVHRPSAGASPREPRPLPRALRVALAIEGGRAIEGGEAVDAGPANASDRRPGRLPYTVPEAPVRARFVDREADPFLLVPEAAVAWLPRQSSRLLPVLVVAAAALATTVAGGCLATLWVLRRSRIGTARTRHASCTRTCMKASTPGSGISARESAEGYRAVRD